MDDVKSLCPAVALWARTAWWSSPDLLLHWLYTRHRIKWTSTAFIFHNCLSPLLIKSAYNMSVEFFSLKQKHQQTHIQVEWNTVKQQNMLIKRKCRDWCAGVSSHRSQEWKVTCLTFPLWVQWLHSGYLKLVTVSCGSSTTEVNVYHNLEFCFFVWVFFFFF